VIPSTSADSITVIIPARNESHRIASTVRAVLGQLSGNAEVVVADDGSSDGTAEAARNAGAVVLEIPGAGNPALARNRGARQAKGSVLLFLDADCIPQEGWLTAHREAHRAGRRIVGGSLALPPGMSWTARADYFATAYHVHPERKPGRVPNHSPANLSVDRSVFEATGGFIEQFPVADGHEELAWQGEARRAGIEIYFDPRAVAQHWNRSGLTNLLRRSYRWGYSALEAKAGSGSSRVSLWYRVPVVAILLAYPVAVVETVYIAAAWLGAGKLEVLQFVPVILLSRLVYAGGLMVGGCRWLLRGRAAGAGARPRWR
jgi:glycosyltransferase involved in cell wall biosynthesis